MERDAVSPLKPKLHKRYVDDIFSKRVKNQTEELFTRLVNNHRNIKFSMEVLNFTCRRHDTYLSYEKRNENNESVTVSNT